MPWVRAIIFQDGQIALIQRRREGFFYSVFPGGGVEAGESPEQALFHEVQEGLGLEIEIVRQVAVTRHGHGEQFYFLCDITRGEFGKGCGHEMSGEYPSKRGTYRPVARYVVEAISAGWPEEAVPHA